MSGAIPPFPHMFLWRAQEQLYFCKIRKKLSGTYFGGHKSRALGLPGDYIWYGGPKCLCVLGMEVFSCHLSGA
jgi:hypothetical protein